MSCYNLNKIIFFRRKLGFRKPDYTKGTYTSEKPNISERTEKINTKCDYFDGNIVNGNKQPNLNSFALYKRSGQKIIKTLRKILSQSFSFE